MGGWKLEVGKMAIYMTFPVALFHYFNQPQFFEEWVTQTKRSMYPPEDTAETKQFAEGIKFIQERQKKKAYEELESTLKV